MATNKILVMTGNYQFGNNPGLFQEAPFVGKSVIFPVSVTYVDVTATDVRLYFDTHDIETWGDWMGHQVLLNGEEVGRLKDPADRFGRAETFEVIIKMADFLRIINYGGGMPSKVELQIVLDTQPAHPGLADDFVLMRIDTSDSAVLRLGW